MNDKKTDNLSKLFPGWEINDREIIWIFLELSDYRDFGILEHTVNSETMRSQIAEYLEKHPNRIKVLKRRKDESFLENHHFNWIDESGSQPDWLLREEKTRNYRVRTNSIFEILSSKETLIAIYDKSTKPLGTKALHLTQLKEAWANHLQEERIFQWFNDENSAEKLELAWSWLESNKPEMIISEAPFKSHQDLLDFFSKGRATFDEKKHYIDKIKRRWSTQKSRKNNPNKKQYNFILNEDTNDALNRLAKMHNVSRTKILEKLIAAEEEYNAYLES